MKIITNDRVYVQKDDLAYLYHSELSIPSFIGDKIFKNIEGIIDDENRYEFVEFNGQDAIEYFKSLDWMIDYSEVKELSQEDMQKLSDSIAEEHKRIAEHYNAMSDEDKWKNIKLYEIADFLEFKYYSLSDVIAFMEGNLSMKLPRGIDNSKSSASKKSLENKENK